MAFPKKRSNAPLNIWDGQRWQVSRRALSTRSTDFADEMISRGLKTVILIGQGGSTQAPMTLTKYNKPDSSLVTFKTLDSVSAVRVVSILAECDPKTTLIIQSSKSGGTIEPTLVMKAVRTILAETLPEEEIPSHLIAITDPGSELEARAKEEGWAKVFSGEPTVGGRYSALSVFGLVPAALVGIDIKKVMESARNAEELCSANDLATLHRTWQRSCSTTIKMGATSFRFSRQSAAAYLVCGLSSW